MFNCRKTDFWQIESLYLRQWVGVVCYRAKKVIPPLHITLVRLIDLSLLKNRADTWFLISSDILVSMDSNWKESGKGEVTSVNTPIEVSFASKVPFLQYFQFTCKNQVCAPKTSSLVQDSCTSQANEQIVHWRSSTFTGAKLIGWTGVVFLNPEKGRRCRSEISRGNASLGWLSNVLKFTRAKTEMPGT